MSQVQLYSRRIMGVETEYGITAVSSQKNRTLTPEEVARYLFRPVVQRYASSNIFTPNGSRLYLDVGSHPEVATAECDSLTQLLNYERAGDVMLNDLACQAEKALAHEGIDTRIYLFKNNVDSVGNSYGCHENYLVGRELVLRNLARQLLPFMITRQLICGAGMIARATAGNQPGFLLSQRADQVWEGVSSATTRSRPIINTRDEPHGDSHRFRRMHVIVGDSNMSEPTFALKVGSTLLLLEMIEAGVDLPDLELADPISHIRDISRDITGSTVLDLKNGGTVTALSVQEQTLAAATQWLDQRPDKGTPTEELRRVVDLWQRQLEAIATGDFSRVDREIDWVIKRNLLHRYLDRLGGDWSHPKLAQVDLAFHDIRPGRGLFPLLEAKGLVDRWSSDEDIAAAVLEAPATTRAHLRGQFITHAEHLGAPITTDWVHLKINAPQTQMVELTDPFAAVDSRVDALLDYLDEHAGEYGEH
ncbi:Pup--protein ligase [Corynebacterium alimapuense]|uniref:Pup--protein ligase n=1 Tax=Corynebacterium alimapuense TaxID=1576874 RepID=A0A3M8K7L9_9CORY|nr:Pup--protein ligase [Corynebacterium alimapuense]RNE49146.1 Pup--protein ligase [Corynebacterium alimapuense]